MSYKLKTTDEDWRSKEIKYVRIIIRILSTFFFILSLLLYWSNDTLERNTIRKGVIISVYHVRATDEPWGYKYNVIFYDSILQKKYKAYNNSSISRKYKIGDSLEVAYNIAQPERAVVNTWTDVNNEWLRWLFLLVFAIFLMVASFGKFNEDNHD